MKYIAVCLLVLFVSTAHGLHNRNLLQRTGATCESKTSTNLFISGGSGTAKANSVCQAQAEAISAIESTIEKWEANVPGDGCFVAEVTAVAEATGLAIADAFSEVGATVEIKGSGRGCAAGFSQADTFAEAFALAIVEAVADARDENGEAFAEARGAAISNAISEAWSLASAAACQTGAGLAEDFDSSFATAVRLPIATTVAEVAVSLCADTGDIADGLEEFRSQEATSTSEVTGEATVDELTNASSGTAGASGGQVKLCGEDVANQADCCSDFNIGKDVGKRCKCSGCKGPVRKFAENTWRDGLGNTCACLAAAALEAAG